MSTAAYMLKRSFHPTLGLDRNHCVELWHVTGIVGWTRANTSSTVLSVVPISRGDPHPDPLLSNAVCISIGLAAGPKVSQDNLGTMEAIVSVVYDSNRTWGAAGYPESGMFAALMPIMVPSFARLGADTNLQRNDFSYLRTTINRIEPRNGTGISEADKEWVAGYVGKRFILHTIEYRLIAAPIRRLASGATIIEYTFLSKSAIPAFQPSPPYRAVVIPALGINEEYVATQNSIGVVSASVLFDPNTSNPDNTLPYWDRRFY